MANRKGGVGKSTSVAAVAEMLATGGRRQGSRVCVIDGDPQGTLSQLDFGLGDCDRGQSLAQAVMFGSGLRVESNPQRPNLDVVPGGSMLSTISGAALSAPDVDMSANFQRALTTLCERNRYDIVLIDSAPGDASLLDIFLKTANYLIIPTREDVGSLHGVGLLAEQFWEARQNGATIELLGVLLFMADPRASRRISATFDQITQLLSGSGVEPFTTAIRVANGVAKDLREHGVTVGELVALSRNARKDRLARLRQKERPDREFWGNDPEGLALDYQEIVYEIIKRLAAYESASSYSPSPAMLESQAV